VQKKTPIDYHNAGKLSRNFCNHRISYLADVLQRIPALIFKRFREWWINDLLQQQGRILQAAQQPGSNRFRSFPAHILYQRLIGLGRVRVVAGQTAK